MTQVIFFSLIGGLFSLIGALILFRDKKEASKIVQFATPFAAGVLLAAAFVSLLPEALEQNTNTTAIMMTALIAFLVFFFLERFLQVFHHHHEHEDKKKKATNSLIIIGDTLHNALDGVAIGAAFLVSPATGIIASIAVALHEIPQEIGDFGLLLKNGMKQKNVILVNIISALATTIIAVIVFGLGNDESFIIPYVLAVTAGFFIYIAASDIVPELHEKFTGKFDYRPWFLLFGALTIMIISPIAHEYIDAGHDDHSHSESEETHSETDRLDNHDENHSEDEQSHSD
jgi:zinc and cadmium transporter